MTTTLVIGYIIVAALLARSAWRYVRKEDEKKGCVGSEGEKPKC